MAGTTLLSTSITSAITATVGAGFSGFGATRAMTVQAKFTCVSAGSSVDAYVQTSLDGGLTFIDVAQFHFTGASATSVVNLVGETAIAAPTAITTGSLAANTTQQGVIGDLWRVQWTSVGSYGAGTTLVVTVQPR
jgi:hypothetical protein